MLMTTSWSSITTKKYSLGQTPFPFPTTTEESRVRVQCKLEKFLLTGQDDDLPADSVPSAENRQKDGTFQSSPEVRKTFGTGICFLCDEPNCETFFCARCYDLAISLDHQRALNRQLKRMVAEQCLMCRRYSGLLNPLCSTCESQTLQAAQGLRWQSGTQQQQEEKKNFFFLVYLSRIGFLFLIVFFYLRKPIKSPRKSIVLLTYFPKKEIVFPF
jgi:hypothetical protein